MGTDHQSNGGKARMNRVRNLPFKLYGDIGNVPHGDF